MDRTKYLITGASGFVGSALLRKLVTLEKDVSIIVRKESDLWRIKDLLFTGRNGLKVKCFKVNLTDLRQLQLSINRIKPSIIYHFATYGAYPYQKEPEDIFKINILGTLNLLNFLSNIDYDLFVNTGTSSEYGRKNTIMRETDTFVPDSYYAISKSAQTLLSSYIATSQEKPIITLRLFSVYGPFEQPTRLIPTLLKSLRNGLEMNLVNPKVARDFVYIDDVISAYLKTKELKKLSGEQINICSGNQSTIKNIVDITEKVTGKSTTIRWGGMENR